MKVYEDLKWRGLVQDISHDELIDELNNGKLTFYIGTDPTADSLHLGHYSSFLITRRLSEAGHTPLILVGAATGLIGDPRGSEERGLSEKENVQYNFRKLKEQINRIFPFEVINNFDWVSEINIIDFFRDYGKYINVNYMLGKDLIKRQMEKGISYAEFSYMLIQALDFKYLYENRGVKLQVAGSDQWGNITTGIELIRKTNQETAYGLVMPLITDSNGKKFGKSEGNAIWLDPEKTSPYELYQFLLNAEDEIVISYLKQLTLLTRNEIELIEKKQNEFPQMRIAQKALAKAIVCDIHGEEEYSNAVSVSEKLFKNQISEIPIRDLLVGLKGVPEFNFSCGNIIDILVDGKICSSKREARELIVSNSISINGNTISSLDLYVDDSYLINKQIIVIRRGKKKYYIGTANM